MSEYSPDQTIREKKGAGGMHQLIVNAESACALPSYVELTTPSTWVENCGQPTVPLEPATGVCKPVRIAPTWERSVQGKISDMEVKQKDIAGSDGRGEVDSFGGPLGLLSKQDIMEALGRSSSSFARYQREEGFPLPLVLWGGKRWLKAELFSWLKGRESRRAR